MDYRAANVTDMDLIPINHRDTVVQGDRCLLLTTMTWYVLSSDDRTWVRETPIIFPAAQNELSSALGYWDVNHPEQFAVAPLLLPPLTGWVPTGLTATAGAQDHFGGYTAISIADDSGSKARSLIYSGSDTETGCAARHGLLSFECWYKPINWTAEGIPTTDVANSNSSQGFRLPVAAPGDSGIANMLYLSAGAKDPADYIRWKRYPDGWYKINWRAHISQLNSSAPYYWTRILFASYAGTNGEIMRFQNFKFSQDRVKTWTSSSGVALSQATDDIRPVVAPVWLNEQNALVEGRETASACSLSGSLALGKTWSLSAVIYTHVLTPETTARSIFTLTGSTASISLQIDPTGVWLLSRTDDAGVTLTTTTTQKVATVPVAVGLVATATALTLYIDGVAASGGVLTYSSDATVTGITVFGGNAYSVLRSIAADTANWTTAMPRVAADMRREAALPDTWLIDILTGQSNANSNKGNPYFWCGSGWRNGPGRAFFLNDYSASYDAAGSWYPGTQELYNSTSHGARVGIMNEGDENHDYRPLICCAKGGTLLSAWLLAAQMKGMLENTVAAAVAALGTSLYKIDTLYLIQGEAEAGTARANTEVTNYLTTLRSFRSNCRAAWNPNLHFVIHRLNAGRVVGADATYISDDLVRAAQDTFASEDELTHVSRLDGIGLLGDAQHYSTRSISLVGRNLYRARVGLPLLPGNWSG